MNSMKKINAYMQLLLLSVVLLSISCTGDFENMNRNPNEVTDGQMDALTLGYNILAYAMPSIALCVCYEYAGNIWAPIGLHMIINALGMSAM